MTNTQTRVLVAFIAIPFILLAALVGGYLWLLFMGVLAFLALREYFALAEARGAIPQRITATVAGIVLLLSFASARIERDLTQVFDSSGLPFPSFWQAFTIIVLFTPLSVMLIELFRRKGNRQLNIGSTLLAVFYIGLCAGTAVGMREIFHPAEFPVAAHFAVIPLDGADVAKLHSWGGFSMIAVLSSIWVCDTAAFFAGKSWGKRKLFERISPKKTWEGAIAGFIAAIGWMILMKYLLLAYLPVGHAVVVGVIVGGFGQIGDLVESMLKRESGIKDSSTMIPGHGGVLDRFDSFFFVSPILFFYFDFIVFA